MMNYRFLPEHKLLVICIWGVTSAEEVQKQRQKIRTSIDLSQNFDTILEVSHFERCFTNEEIHTFSQSSFDAFLSGKKLAIIASSDLAYGIMRMYEGMAYSDISFEISVFRDASSALMWLGREGIDIESIFEKILGEVK
jgi:hypothetical protein